MVAHELILLIKADDALEQQKILAGNNPLSAK